MLLLKIDNQVLGFSFKAFNSSSSLKSLLPTIFTNFNLAVEPSSISILNLTLFRSKSSEETSTWAPYLPWDMYCLSNSELKFSKIDLLNKVPSYTPDFFKPSSKFSVLIALFPSISISSMVGLSLRLINKALLSLPS